MDLELIPIYLRSNEETDLIPSVFFIAFFKKCLTYFDKDVNIKKHQRVMKEVKKKYLTCFDNGAKIEKSQNGTGPLVKRFNTHAFHACIHGFESRTGHHQVED